MKPMHLSQAIQKIIATNGINILKERRFINMLSDYQAFDSIVLKNTLNQIYSHNFGVQIYNAYLSRDIIQINAVKQSIIYQFGNTQIVNQIFNALNDVIGLSLNNPHHKTQSSTPYQQQPNSVPNKKGLKWWMWLFLLFFAFMVINTIVVYVLKFFK